MTTENKKAPTLPLFFTIRDIAERCRVSARTVQRWIRDGELTIHRLGRQIRISEQEFAHFLRRHRE